MTFLGRVPLATRTSRWLGRSLMLFGLLMLLVGQAARAESAPSWKQLTPAQQHILAPLRADWGEFDHDRKKKWLDIAARYPAMSPEQQQILQRRMNEWAHLSPEKRRLARETFLSTGKAPLQSRREAWEAYKKLPEAERQRLKEEAKHPKPHPGQVGKYLQDKQRRENSLPPVPAKLTAPAAVSANKTAAATTPAAATMAAPPPPGTAITAPAAAPSPLPRAASAPAPCSSGPRCPAR